MMSVSLKEKCMLAFTCTVLFYICVTDGISQHLVPPLAVRVHRHEELSKVVLLL